MPSTEDLDARGPDVRSRVKAPLLGTRCPRCHRPAGRRQFFPGAFLGLGVPCALCSPIRPSEVYALVFHKRAILEVTTCDSA